MSTHTAFAKLTVLFAILTLVLFAATTQADTVTVTPDGVSRLLSGAEADLTHTDFFSTHDSLTQKTLVATTNANFLTELQNVLGSLGTGESYQVNSATLTVGATADDYTTIGGARAHVVIVPWTSAAVTWNNFNGGGVAGVDYNAAAADTGTVASPTTTWSGLASTVQDWLDGAVTNNGLFFPDTGEFSLTEVTATENVSWTLDAQIVSAPAPTVPEPSTFCLAAFGLVSLGLVAWRRRRRA